MPALPSDSPVFRIIGSRAPFGRKGARSKWLWHCAGPDHASWLITLTNGETLGPFDNSIDAQSWL
jgi:hypothetical protein